MPAWKKNQWVQLRVLTEAVCENIFRTIENRVLTRKKLTHKITVHIWIITGGTRKITVGSSIFYSVLQYILRCDTVKMTFMYKLLEWTGKVTVCSNTFYGVTQ